MRQHGDRRGARGIVALPKHAAGERRLPHRGEHVGRGVADRQRLRLAVPDQRRAAVAHRPTAARAWWCGRGSRADPEPRRAPRKFEPCVSDAKIETTFALSSTGNPRNSARSANAKPIVAAPIASASVATISDEVPGLRAQHAERRAQIAAESRTTSELLLGYVSDCCGERLAA